MDTIKRVGYLIIVGLFVLTVLISKGGNDIPAKISIGVGSVLALIGIALAIWELRSGKPLFYSYGKNWFGGYINNSAFILGISVGFFAITTRCGFTALGAVAAVYVLICLIFGQNDFEHK